MDSLPLGAAIAAPAVIPPQPSSVAINPAALLSAAAMQAPILAASVPAASSSVQDLAALIASAPQPVTKATQVQQPGIQSADDAAGSDRENVANVMPNGGLGHHLGQIEMKDAAHVCGMLEEDSLTKLPQLGLTLSPTKGLSCVPSKSTPKVATPRSARSGTPKGGRGTKGRPPRSASNLGRRDSSFTASDSGEGRTLLHRNSTG